MFVFTFTFFLLLLFERERRKREEEEGERRRRTAGGSVQQSVTHLGPSRLPPAGPSPPLLTRRRSQIRGVLRAGMVVAVKRKEVERLEIIP